MSLISSSCEISLTVSVFHLSLLLFPIYRSLVFTIFLCLSLSIFLFIHLSVSLFHLTLPLLIPVFSLLSPDENLSFCWQYVTADLVCQSPLLGGQVTFTECCCLYGEGWGLQCALCPARDSGTTRLTAHSLMSYYGHADCG